jgi:hypothetical protein
VHNSRLKATPRGRRNSAIGRWRKASALAFAGVTLVGLFAFAGYQLGHVSVARAVAPVEFDLALDPSPTTLRKSSLVTSSPPVEAAAPPAAERPIRASLVAPKSDNFFEDSLAQSRVGERGDRLYRLVSPPVGLIEKYWQRGREQRRKVAELTCLARAIYFEARSESEIGRLAVAQVIMNRVKSPFYPNTICEVVYQNAQQANACQFSFACDGKSDRPRQGSAWKVAKTLAARAMAGDGEVQAIATATNYHADYVAPKWTGTMTRLVKIGRHIFYSGG